MGQSSIIENPKTMFVIFLFGLLVVTTGLELVPPPNTWVRDGQTNVTLVCKASDKIRSCSWSTPYGKTYPLESGLMAEGGRLLHFTMDKDKECGVLITNIEAQDNGRWKCNVGVVENSEVSTASGMANVNIATAPDDIFLEEPFDQLSTNFTLGVTYDVKCVVKNTKPAPKYVWMIDEEEVDGKTMDEEVFVDPSGLSTFSQVFSYQPKTVHANKTLRCVVQHPGLANDIAAATEVRIVGGQEASIASAGVSSGGVVGIVFAVIVVFALAAISVLAWQGKFSRDEKKEKIGEEKGTVDPEADKTSQTESAHDETKIDEAKTNVNKTLQSKITTFFAAMKPKEKKREDDIVATEWEKVDLNAQKEETETEDEKKDAEKEESVEETEVKQSSSLGGKITTFLAKFKKTATKSEELDKVTTEGEKHADEAIEELKELEPEDKEDKIVDEKEKRIGSETPV